MFKHAEFARKLSSSCWCVAVCCSVLWRLPLPVRAAFMNLSNMYLWLPPYILGGERGRGVWVWWECRIAVGVVQRERAAACSSLLLCLAMLRLRWQ
mmetsp:Transcript_21452/g.17780  ORF Transcript_21452/g.17780 Transcript_21452/m.17780 type:complete len:96 (-) Transcript_21452:67-354(-)